MKRRIGFSGRTLAVVGLIGPILLAAGAVGLGPAVASAQGTGTILVVSGSGQTATVGTSFASTLQVQVVDQNDQPVVGDTVTFTAPSTGPSGTFASSSNTDAVLTDANGFATDTFTANTVAGSYEVTATADSAANTATFDLTNTVGAAASVTILSGADQTTTVGTAFATPVSAQVTDAYGNPVPGETVTLTAPSTGASATFAGGSGNSVSLVTDATGTVSDTATADAAAGSYSVTASDVNVVTSPTLALTNAPGPAANVAIAAGSSQSTVVNTAFGTSLAVKVTDTYGNAVSGVTVTWYPPSPQGEPAGTFASTPQAVTGTNGVATAPVLTANGTTGSFSVNATAAGVSKVLTFKLTNLPPAPTITKVKPTSTKVGKAVTIIGTNLANATVTFTAGTGITPAVTWTVVSNSKIVATIPAGATTGVVSVTTPGGTATSPKAVKIK